MRLHDLIAAPHKSRRRVGRGIAAGQGKTAGRGTKGQKARTGANSNIPRGFVGGATSFMQKLPKLKGFTSHRVKPVALNSDRIRQFFDAEETITLHDLVLRGLVDDTEALQGIKIVGDKTGLKIEESPLLTVSGKKEA
jgi:large subunit ribosomal protein L15